MDVGAIASSASGLTQAQTADAVQIAVQKKAMDIEQQSADQLIQSVAQSMPSNPPHLGNSVNVFA
jgi:hypothetical protein